MRPALAVVVALLVMTGCAEFSAMKSGIATHGASAADQALEAARWGACTAATVGAIKRRYANDPTGLRGWQDYCSDAQVIAPVPIVQ